LLREVKDELLIADTGNKVLRRIYNLQSPIPSIETFAGGSTVLDSPIGLARDQVGLFLIVDKGAHRLTSLTTTIKPRVADPIVGRVIFRVDPLSGIEIAEIERVVDAIFEETQLIVVTGDGQGTHLFTAGSFDLDSLDQIMPPRPETPGVNPALNFPSPSNRREAFKDAINIDPRPVLTLRAATYDLNDPERVPSRVISGTFRFRCSAPSIETERIPGAVTFSCATTNVTIGYTLNGDVPDLSSPNTIPVSDIENFSIPMPVGKTLKARAFRPGFSPSTVSTRSDFVPVFISLGFSGGEASSDFVGAPGQRFFAPITLLTPPRPSAYGLQFSLAAHANSPAPEIDARTFGFTSMLEENRGATNRVIPNAITVGFDTNIFYDTNYIITNILQPGGGVVTVTNAIVEPFFTNVFPIFDGFQFVNLEDRVMGVGWMEIPGQTNLYNTKIQDLIRFSRARDIVYSSVNGRIIPGAFSFQVPPTATVGSTYAISVDRSSATAAGNRDVYVQPVRPEQTRDTNNPAFGLIPAVRDLALDTRWYTVGDVLPFRWLNAGDFGDTNILNNDLQALYQAVIYELNLPPPGSDFADALDSCCVTVDDIDLRQHANYPFSNGNDLVIDQIAFGDGVLDISDIWISYRRALDHTLKWYQRAWGRAANGTPRRIARETPNLFREQIGRLSTAASPSGSAPISARGASGHALASRLTLALAQAISNPGGWVEIPVTARVDGSVPLRALLFNVIVEAADGGVPLLSGLSFAPSSALGAPSLLFNSIPTRLGAAWLETDTAGLLGERVLGTIRFQIPEDAPANTIYRLRFANVSGSPNGISLFPATTAAGCVVMSDRPASAWHDGISDVWRAQYFGSVRNPSSLANLDPDGDGVSNAAEFSTGTHPLDASDSLKVQLRTLTPRGVAVRWSGALGKRYLLESSSLLTPGSWSQVTDPIDGNGGEIEIEQEGASSQLYYRIRLADAP
jgi:Chitobiase/beta-hexosaminidase C-terminal domain